MCKGDFVGRCHPCVEHRLWPARVTPVSNGLWLSWRGSRWTWVLVLAKGELVRDPLPLHSLEERKETKVSLSLAN